jgi:hypothetical protein
VIRDVLGAAMWSMVMFVATPVIFVVLFFATRYWKGRQQ